ISQAGETQESLQASWVKLHLHNNENGSSVSASVSIYNGDMKKILLISSMSRDRDRSKSSPCYTLHLSKIISRENKKLKASLKTKLR
uniref:Uncharacterized protein n=1 Tax=Piliocolobus tephrosceles TaxID=591936 RepID=A0A8C9HVS9_9PRIM